MIVYVVTAHVRYEAGFAIGVFMVEEEARDFGREFISKSGVDSYQVNRFVVGEKKFEGEE